MKCKVYNRTAMPRATPPLQLPHSPLIFVLAQVKISPVMAIEDRIPELQELFRKRGYPRLSQRKIEVSAHGPDGQVEPQKTLRQWEFINKEGTASLLIDENGLTYQMARYEVFETLIESMRTALEIFTKQVEPDLLQRVGLRYVDLVVPTEGKAIHSYFAESLRGFSISAEEDREAFFCESVSRTGKDSRFVHRYVEANRGFGFPPDLLPVSLELRRDPGMKSPFGLLDLDHHITVEEDFSVDSAIAHFEFLHHHQTLAFKASVTPAALEEWRQP